MSARVQQDRAGCRLSGEEGRLREHACGEGWTPAARAQEYEQHYRSEVLPVLQGVAGFEGARLLRRTTGDETEFVSLTFFDDLDAVRAFAGPDYETAVVADEAARFSSDSTTTSATTKRPSRSHDQPPRELLARFEQRSQHYEVRERRIP